MIELQEKPDLVAATESLNAARLSAQLLWVKLRNDSANRRLLYRYVRALRKCERIRREVREIAKQIAIL